HEHSAAHYGIFMAAMGLGAVVGGLMVARRSRPTPKMLALLMLGFGLSLRPVSILRNCFRQPIRVLEATCFTTLIASRRRAPPPPRPSTSCARRASMS